ncbi:hypothetical protein OC842_004290 [Tilletia horrida]|uniref:Uncharacterized protein n=1 Tax=Tilletia horrida TaxID=155126 RepID=A0AAN6GEP9_9BASI|nr:hypothetical protein OC842_004290 [Tilletia horrida]
MDLRQVLVDLRGDTSLALASFKVYTCTTKNESMVWCTDVSAERSYPAHPCLTAVRVVASLEHFKADRQVLVHGLIHGTAPPFTLDVIVQADDGHTVKLSGETSYPAKKYDFGDVKQMSTQNIGQKKINFYRARVPLQLCKDEHHSRSIKLKLKWAGPTPSISSDFELQIESSVMIFPGCILWILRSMYRFGQTSPLQPQAGRLTLSVTSSDNVLSVSWPSRDAGQPG